MVQTRFNDPRPSIGPRCQFCRQPAGREQKFCGACGAALPLQCARTQATVVFIDVCGFTSISERLDPEDVRMVMERVFDVVLEAVHAHSGRVNQFLGDGVMALFGDVDGAEHHAVRALQAAVAIQHNLDPIRSDVRREHGIDFRVRAGVHTGPVTMGVIGRGLRNDYVAQGETTSVAARLVSVAQADQILVSDGTRDLAASAFRFTANVGPLPASVVVSESCDRVDAEVSLLAEV
jgi:class 3 adenylate cyclase